MEIVSAYNIFLVVMTIIALFVFIGLQFFEAGYGYLFDRRYGPPVNNKVGWVLMESPVFIMMCVLWAMSDRQWDVVPLVLFAVFQLHYFQRSFIFPLMMRGNSKMPLGIVLMGMLFNTLNALMQGGWIFFIAPEGYYADWFSKPYIYIGVALFFAGMAVNMHSDYIIRHLRKPGDTKHYIPRKGFYKYVTSANYFGEFTEWVGYAILTWSPAGALFAIWTFANLGPRAKSLTEKYEKEFGEEYTRLNKKHIIPFIW